MLVFYNDINVIDSNIIDYLDCHCFSDISANVAYQEFDIPEDFPFHLRQYIPNVFYRPSVHDEYMDTLGKRYL